MRIVLSAAVAGAFLLAGCDAVRYPGDGGPAPERPSTPEQPANMPIGAPGPPPPAEPVADPYGQGDPAPEPADVDETNETEEPVETPVPVEPDTGETDEPGDVEEEPTESEPETPTPVEPVPDETEPAPEDEPTEEPVEEPTSQPETPVDEVPDENEDEVPVDEVEQPVDTSPDPQTEPEPTFSYVTPGSLIAGSGTGSQDQTIHSPNMVFPIKSADAYPQSMVWRFGGGIGGGDECDPRNFAYPWQDNFCEKRSSNRNSPFCPLDKIHQGQDIRVGTPAGCNEMRRADPEDRMLYEVVATEDGIISNIGSYTVNLRSGGRIYRYMHLNMRQLKVSLDQEVKAGDVLGYVSKDFGGSATTFHLHFEIIQNTAEHGWAHVSPYTSLVAAYERREGGPGEEVEQNLSIAASRSFIAIPDDFIITE